MEGERRTERLLEMRLTALRLMHQLDTVSPHLIGSVLTGHIRRGSDIDIHVFTNTAGALSNRLEDLGLEHTIERKHAKGRVFTHIHINERFPIELTVYEADKVNFPFKSSISHKTIERASVPQLEALIEREHPGVDLASAIERLEDHIDLIELYRMLLAPLEGVKQNPRWHPEGDALFHSLQVYQLAIRERPYDVDFILAALLHDVGKAIDPPDHALAAVIALEEAISERTAFLIEHHMDAHAYRDGTLGARARRRLEADDSFEDLLLLSELDQAGRVPGAAVPTLDEVIDHLRTLLADVSD